MELSEIQKWEINGDNHDNFFLIEEDSTNA